MGTKANPGKYDCYANALPDEPMFVLLARDPDFARLVNEWVKNRVRAIDCGERPESDWPMVTEATLVAKTGAEWRKANMNHWRKQRD